MVNSILRYYKPVGLPNPNGSLSRVVPSKAIESANRQVEAAVARQSTCKSRKRGPYRRYTDEERARIAVEHGVVSTAQKFSKELDVKINENTVRSFKKLYEKERARKRTANDTCIIDELPLLLWAKGWILPFKTIY